MEKMIVLVLIGIILAGAVVIAGDSMLGTKDYTTTTDKDTLALIDKYNLNNLNISSVDSNGEFAVWKENKDGSRTLDKSYKINIKKDMTEKEIEDARNEVILRELSEIVKAWDARDKDTDNAKASYSELIGGGKINFI